MKYYDLQDYIGALRLAKIINEHCRSNLQRAILSSMPYSSPSFPWASDIRIDVLLKNGGVIV